MTPPVSPTLPKLADTEPPSIFALPRMERLKSTEVPALLAHMVAQPNSASLLMNQYSLFTILGNRNFALEMQIRALALTSIYRVEGATQPKIHLLAFMGYGDMSDNTPLDYLIEDSDIRLDLLYVQPDSKLPDFIPDHDVAIVALGESSKNLATLEFISNLAAGWPRPVLNQPKYILQCARDATYQLLKHIPELFASPTVRVSRSKLERFASSQLTFEDIFEEAAFPLTVRPIDTQAGAGLCKIETHADLTIYLESSTALQFYVSRFVDYRSSDGLYRKVRIALIDGVPYAVHLAIGEHWIVNYQSAGMADSPEKRLEEDKFMHHFESQFAERHRSVLFGIARQLALDYVVIDCAELPDGGFLLFEADNRGWVHATDPLGLLSHKQAAMSKLFAAFRSLLLKHMI